MKNVIITHYEKDGGEVVYKDGKPSFKQTIVSLPLRFGYGSYNEPRKLLDYNIDVDDILRIDYKED